jgi:hypothetical protein
MQAEDEHVFEEPTPEVEQEPEPEVEPEPEPLPQPETKLEPKSSSHSIHYRFGVTTENVKNKLVEFIMLSINNPGPFVSTPDETARELKLTTRARDVFINHLSSMRLDGRPLIMKNKFGEYVANFSSEEIIAHVTEVINDEE